jgi:2-oxoglutarate dehydrogenase E1 component
MYTQPKLYERITKHPDTLSVYAKQLLDEATCTAQTLEEIKTMVNATLEADFQAAKTWEVGGCPAILVSPRTHAVNCFF